MFAYLLSVEIFFLPKADDQTFPIFVSKVQNVVCSLEVGLRIISFRRPFGLVFKILMVTRGQIVGAC